MRSQIGARIGKLEERRRPTMALPSKEQRDARVRALMSDPEQVAALMANLDTDPAKVHVIAAALRADT